MTVNHLWDRPPKGVKRGALHERYRRRAAIARAARRLKAQIEAAQDMVAPAGLRRKPRP